MSSIAKVAEYWDSYAESLSVPGEEWGSQEFFQHLKAEHDIAYRFSNRVLDIPSHRGHAVLELMCGIGIDALELARAGAQITFLSPSQKCVDLTRSYFSLHGEGATLQVGNPEEVGFAPETYDVVIARGILMFARRPQRVADEIYRVLKPGGVVYAHLHNRYSWYVLLARLSSANMVQETGDPPIHRLHDVKAARALFADFSSVDIYLDRFPTRTRARSGSLGRLYNNILVPLTRVCPRWLIRPFGYYIIVKAIKGLRGKDS